MDDRDVEDLELAERLEAYAEARLSPSLSASSRMRTHVMAAAERQAALLRADADRAAFAAAELASRPRRTQVVRWRRPVAALLAASLTLALAVGSVAAARPGGPLYGTRIWAETLTLPSTAADRAAAEVRRLNDRLAEAAEAAAAGDANAADAALAAYNAILAEAMAGTNGNAVANATLNAAVRRNIEVLTALLGRATFPDQARDAIEHAIEQSDSATNGLQGQPGVGGPPSSNPGNGPAATNGPDRTANPNKPTAKPVDATRKPHENATPPPHPTPKQHSTPEPAAVTPAPDHTPRASGRPSNPPGNGNEGG
ncbi:MAG: hypothetical protein ACXWXR_09855 [Candidatus Limnocylindrales bacterium]